MQCTRWEERPVYIMFSPHRANIWHLFNDAIMGAFGTLREEGLLPLAEVDGRGGVREYTDDVDLDSECPMVIDDWRSKFDSVEDIPYRRPTQCRPKVGGGSMALERSAMRKRKSGVVSKDWFLAIEAMVPFC